jgi:hypothetical protein
MNTKQQCSIRSFSFGALRLQASGSAALIGKNICAIYRLFLARGILGLTMKKISIGTLRRS